MSSNEIKLQCLRMAAEMRPNPVDALEAAKKFYDWIMISGNVPAKKPEESAT